MVLLALKTLELRARRDAFVIFFLGFFTMLTNFFFSQSLATAAAMLLALLGLLTALVNAHMPVGKPPLAQAARTAGWMALLGAPVMAVLFVLFPRIGAAVGHPQRRDDRPQRPVGHACRWATSPAWRWTKASPMRVQVRRRRCRRRATCISAGRCCRRSTAANGGRCRRAWARALRCRGRQPQLQVLGEPVRYEVTLEPNNRPWLLVLDAAARPPDRARLRDRR